MPSSLPKKISSLLYLLEILSKTMLSLLPPLLTLLLFNTATGTEQQCHNDCRAVPRIVGPTRPSDEIDALGNPIPRPTRSYPYHVASTEEYDFPRFCELGCSYFFISSGASMPKSTLDQCMDQCDDTFAYNVTVGYNDVLETARYECRDGCQIGLLRCQPGYYCIQASPSETMTGGDMLPCPVGTFRGVEYDQVAECVPCPPNHFREDIKGKSLSACTKCPANTSSRQRSISILDCLRCPAGTMSSAGTSCICITPQACDANQLPFPADAEKKDSVPYIGRW
mmetsp:Transcript_5444/g.7858  ORF Transcript_5444/g.7858 Transcript_5444/m.7858 type:complete len:282 (-) Transcript_5444:984-1829(-)